MWAYIPSNTCPSAPETADSISASIWRSALLARSATSSAKHLPSKSWLRAWKTDSLTRLLFGRICEPSTAALGAASFIASLEDIRASHGPTSARDLVLRTPGISGLPSQGYFGIPLLHTVILKTSKDIFPSDSRKSEPSYEEWATGLKRDYSRRRKSMALMFARDFSFLGRKRKFWPTPRVCEGLRTSGCNRTEFYRVWDSTLKAMETKKSPRFRPNRIKSKNGRRCFSKSRSLNPLFVTWLMNQPLGWPNAGEQVASTSFASWEIASCRLLRRTLLSYFSDVLSRDD